MIHSTSRSLSVAPASIASYLSNIKFSLLGFIRSGLEAEKGVVVVVVVVSVGEEPHWAKMGHL